MKNPFKNVESIYNWIGPVYNLIYGKIAFNNGRSESIRMLEIKPGDKILEVGVGTGLTLPMYPKDCKITGIDLSESMLKEARILISNQRLTNCSVHKMNAVETTFADNSFDGVLGNLFISATNDPVKALLEMKRVCKPNGILVLMNHFKCEEPLLAKMEEAFTPVGKMIGFNSALEMYPLIESANLEIKEITKVNFFNLWTAVSFVNKK